MIIPEIDEIYTSRSLKFKNQSQKNKIQTDLCRELQREKEDVIDRFVKDVDGQDGSSPDENHRP